MHADTFYDLLVSCADQSPHDRFVTLSRLHTSVVQVYAESIRRITPEEATRIVSDGRTIAQVVGHIAAWERNIIVAVGEVLAGVVWPRLMSRNGYIDPDGSTHNFPNVTAFNAYYAMKHATQSWETLQVDALDTAATLYQLFTRSGLVTPARLERTVRYDRYELPIGKTLAIPCGWFLWMIILEHEAVEHANDLSVVSFGL